MPIRYDLAMIRRVYPQNRPFASANPANPGGMRS